MPLLQRALYQPTRVPRWVALLMLAVFGVAAMAHAQADTAPELLGRPIVGVTIEGEAATMLSSGDLQVPDEAVLSRQLVRELIQRLISSGRWTDVQVAADAQDEGVRLIVTLTARALVTRIDLRGSDAVDASELQRQIELQPGAQVSGEALERVRAQMLQAYAERGYHHVELEIGLRDTDDPTRKVLLIEVEEGAPTRVKRIVVKGDHPLDRAGFYRALAVDVGDVLDQTQIMERARRAALRLRRHGYLEATISQPSLQIDGMSADVVIETHVGPLYRVEIVGQQPMLRGQVLTALALGEEPLTSASHLDAVRERAVDLYRRQGFVDARASVRKRVEQRAGRAVLHVRVQPGAQLEVVAIGFPGARHFESAFLESQVVSYLEEEHPGGSMFSPVDSDVADDAVLGPGRNERSTPIPPSADAARTFYEPTYEAAVKHIEQLYQVAGFLSVRVGPARLERTANQRAVVAVPITEGPRTMLHSVRLLGNQALGAQELAEESRLRRAMPFSYLALEEARARMLQLYKERGYLYAKVEPSVRFSPDHTRAEVTIEIVERYQVQVGEIVIVGATRTDTGLIRDLVGFRPGDVYRPSVAQESEERLLALGVFSGVTIAPEDVDLPARSKRVEVTVTQRPSQIIDLKAGISTGQGARGGLEYGYRDLFGQAIGLTLRLELAYQFFFVQQEIARRYEKLVLQDRLERNVTLSLVIPQILRGTGVRTSVELFHVRDNQRDFGLDKNGLGLGFSYRPARRLTLTLNGDVENNNIDLFIDAASKEELIATLLMSGDPADRAQALRLQLTRVPDGNSYLVAGRTSASYDHRDSPFSPTRGYYSSISMELARTLKTEEAKINSQFLKVAVTGSGYVAVTRNVVLALQARVGYIIHLLDRCGPNPTQECSRTYPNRAFFMGGIDTMRGYFQDAMVPQDQISTILAARNQPMEPGNDEPVVDANAFVRSGDAFVLYRAELRFPLIGDLHGAAFTDVGNLWADPTLINPFEVRASVGAGLRLVTPVGPLAFDYGIVVGAREELGEPRYGTVHFAMGLF